MFARKLLYAIVFSLLVGSMALPSNGQAQTARSSSVLPSGGGQALLDPSDKAVLLLDHQTGLFQTVKDIGITELRANTKPSRRGRGGEVVWSRSTELCCGCRELPKGPGGRFAGQLSLHRL